VATDRRRDWYRIEAKADTKAAEVWIYDAIGADFFGDGVSAKSFAAELKGIDAEQIVLHLNTPGGDAFQGLAIYNALKDHPAKVTVSVDGLAASAGSFIAQAGDRIRMNRGAQMMIHDAAGFAMGNAADMTKLAEVLDKTSTSLAEIYASRAGGTVDDWREAMRAESWYTATEAVDAGLADEMVNEEPPEPPVRNSWDLSVFAYAGRDKAPAPPILNRRQGDPPTRREPSPAPVTTGAFSYPTEGAGRMDPAKIREALGLAADASDDEVKAALAANGLANQPDPPTEPAPDPAPEEPAISDPRQPVAARAAGTMVIDSSAWQEREDRIKRLEAADAKRRREERDQVISSAVLEGKFAPSRKEHWARLWDADPEGTRQVIDGLTKNVVPTSELGYGVDNDGTSLDDEYKHLFPPSYSRKGA
jgi:ATP-dependent protease ClpP protease subunit